VQRLDPPPDRIPQSKQERDQVAGVIRMEVGVEDSVQFSERNARLEKSGECACSAVEQKRGTGYLDQEAG
jgi:hypothetical protein